MTAYYVIGKYALDATHEEKVRALRECVETAAYELLELGQDEDDVREHFENAVEGAVLDYESDATVAG